MRIISEIVGNVKLRKMRKFLAVLALVFIGCSDDDEEFECNCETLIVRSVIDPQGTTRDEETFGCLEIVSRDAPLSDIDDTVTPPVIIGPSINAIEIIMSRAGFCQ